MLRAPAQLVSSTRWTLPSEENLRPPPTHTQAHLRGRPDLPLTVEVGEIGELRRRLDEQRVRATFERAVACRGARRGAPEHAGCVGMVGGLICALTDDGTINIPGCMASRVIM